MADTSKEQDEQRGPRVVDKRVSSRPTSEAAPQPSPVATPPIEAAPEPSESAQPVPSMTEEVWTPEAEAEARAIAEEIARRPSIEWVVNTAVTLANVAATKLDMGHASDAQLAIDALTGLLNSVGDKLGNVEQPLRQTLAQLQMAYAEGVAGQGPTINP